MQLALSLGGYYTSVSKYVEAAEYSESHGIQSLWLPDSQMIHRDLYVSLALCAARTKRIKLGTAVTNPVTRDITITACAISTLDEISNGRAILGIGPGDSSVRRIDRSPATVSQLEIAVSNIRRICRGEELKFLDGDSASMRWSRRDIPIYISATGPRMLELAGRAGDGVIVNVGTGDAAMRNALSKVKKGLDRRRGRPSFQVADFSFVSLSEDRRSAIEAARPYVVWYWKNARHLFRENGIETKSLERVDMESKYVEHDYIHADSLNSASVHSNLITDEMVDNFTVAGTPEDCLKKLRNKERAGVGVFIARHTGDEVGWRNFLKLYCESIVTEFK
jgi:5,10-methylenetetrahydromethanopterin reductase